LSKWLAKAKAWKTQDSGRGKEVSDKDTEISRLRRENAELRMEREILKKATAYFAKGRCPVRIHEKGAAILSAEVAVQCDDGIAERLL